MPEFLPVTALPMSRGRAVAIGCSAGGIEALRRILPGLPADFPLPIIIVSHTAASVTNLLPDVFRPVCALPVEEAGERCPVLPGHVYVSPPSYHLLIEPDRTFALSVDGKVRNVRPAIDVLFASAADAYASGLIGVVLTGANDDGSRGVITIKAKGGRTMAQDPAGAFARAMPEAAIATGSVDAVVPLDGIAARLIGWAGRNGA